MGFAQSSTTAPPKRALLTADDPLDSKLYALAMHTSSPELGLALSNGSNSRHQTWQLGQALSTHLHLHLNEFIQPQSWTDLAWLAITKGPGSFTGTRIGVVTARTLAQQLQIPLFAFSTLAAIAWAEAAATAFQQEDIAVQMSASRGELFVAIYGSRGTTALGSINSEDAISGSVISEMTALLPDTVMTHQAWEQILQAWQRPHRLVVAAADLGSFAVSLLEMANFEWQRGLRPDWSIALPFYGQHPVQP